MRNIGTVRMSFSARNISTVNTSSGRNVRKKHSSRFPFQQEPAQLLNLPGLYLRNNQLTCLYIGDTRGGIATLQTSQVVVTEVKQFQLEKLAKF
jgi:hypothetical protein